MLIRRSVIAVLASFATSLAAAQPYQTDFPPEEFKARWAKVFDAIGRDAVAVVGGAPLTNGYQLPRQSNTFYYLSGIETPGAYLLLDGGDDGALAAPGRSGERDLRGVGTGRGPRPEPGRAAGRGRRDRRRLLGRPPAPGEPFRRAAPHPPPGPRDQGPHAHTGPAAQHQEPPRDRPRAPSLPARRPGAHGGHAQHRARGARVPARSRGPLRLPRERGPTRRLLL